MAKKVILKDLNEIEILPITRGELVLDSSGKKAFHSEEFLATSSLPGLMSKTDKTKVDNATTLSQAIPYIVGNASDSAGTWTGSYTGINEYTDGLTIIYVPKVAGASTTTLNINNLGAKTCHYTGTSKLATHYAANTPILLTYLGGYWKRADYNVDTYTSAYSVTSGETAGKTASCSGYQLKPNSYVHITFTNTNTYLGALTLNINTKGAKPIWINRKASSSSNYTLPAGTYLAYYDGSSYHIRTDGTLPGIIEDSYGAKYISLYVNTTSSATTSKNKYYKFATINLTDADWSECSINFLFAAIEERLPNGLLILSVRRGNSITSLIGSLKWLSLDSDVYKDSVVLCNTDTDGVYDLYFQPKKDYCLVRITAITSRYEKLQMGNKGYFEEVTPRITSKLSGYVHHAEKITCTEGVANKDYPIISTSNSTGIYESLLYNPNITLNPSTGEIKATKFTGIFNGTSNLVANNLILKIKSGSTEGTSLYTYNGSSAKTLDIKQGTGITLTAAANALTITNSGVRSIATGTTNGTISVNTNGTSANVAVKGLDSAAYTNKNIYQKQATYVNNSGEVDVYKKITITKADTDGYGIWVHSRQQHYLLNSGAAAMSTPMNTFWELGTSSNSGPVNRTISIKMIAPASSSNVTLYVLVRAYTYILVVSSGTILIADSTQAEYDNITSSTTGWVECKTAKWTDTTYNVVSSSANGLAPKLINTNTNTVGSAYYVLASANGSATPSWYKLPSTAFANDTKVTLTNTTASASYRVLLSGNANDTTETTTARKSANLLFNPNTEILSTTYVLAKGLKGKAESLEGLMNAGLALTYNRLSASSFSNETGITAKDNANGVLWVGTHGSEAGNTSGIGYGHMLGFVGSGGALYHKVVTNGNTSGSWKRIAYTTSDITGNAATATKLQTKRKLWGLDFDGSADVSGSLTGVTSINMDGDIIINDGTNKDRYIKWLYINTDSYGWRIGYLGSGGANNNFLVFDSYREKQGWATALKFEHTTMIAHFGATVNAPTFQGNLDGTYVNALTGYSKAESASDLAATDTLNTALGKLEYKADTTYDWYKSVTGTDNDDIINKWEEIVDFIDSVKEGTDILDEFVTRKTALTITGLKTFLNKINIKTAESNKTPRLVFDEYYSSSSPSWVSEIVSDYFGTNICKTTDFTHGLYITLGRSGFDNLIILNSSKSPIARISKEKGHWFEGTLTVTGNTTSAKFITSGGTASLFVKGDGSLDSTSYATSASLGNYLPLTGGTLTGLLTLGSNSYTQTIKWANKDYQEATAIAFIGNYGDWVLRTTYKADGITADLRFNKSILKINGNIALHSGNYSEYLPMYDGTRMDKNTEFYKRYITVNGTNYAFVSNTNSSTSATIYAHTSVNKNRFSYSTSTGLSYTDLQYLKFVPNDNSGYPVYLLIADLTNWVKGTLFSALLIGTMYGQRAGNLARSVVYNICAHMTSYTGGSQWTLYTDIYNRRVLQPYVVIYNGTKYLALKKEGSLDNMYFVGLALGLLDTYVNVPCPNNTDLPEGLTIECSPTTTSMYLATTKVWDGTNARDIIHSGNYTTYSGYIGTTKVQATGAELSLTGIKNINASGTATIQGALSLGKADSSNLFFERTGPAYIWANAAGGYLTFGVKDVGGTSNTNASLVIQSAHVLPGMRNDAVTLGSSSYRWKNVYSKLGNFLNQVLIGTETALNTGCVLNVNGNTYQRGEFKITNDVHGVRLLGNGGFGYVLMGNISDITRPHCGKITGISARYLSSLDVDCLQTNLTGRLKVANGLAITATSNQQFLLMGNQDGAGTNNPVVIKVANGILRFGNGDSWSDVNGGTFTEHLKITSSQITSARKISAPLFIKSDSSNSYALLGGGGHKALSDFALKSELNDLALSNNVITFSKEITFGSDWVDTGIVFNSTNFPLGNGSYLVLVSRASMYYVYTGVMSIIISTNVTHTLTEEILLHGGGFDSGSSHIYLRTYGDTTDKVFKLQIARSATSGTRTYTFKFIKLL